MRNEKEIRKAYVDTVACDNGRKCGEWCSLWNICIDPRAIMEWVVGKEKARGSG